MRRSAIALVFILVLPATVAGPTSRDTLKPTARTLLKRADALHRRGDNPGALDAYMEAVDADPNAANLEAIDTYAFPFVESRDKILAEKKRAALRQFLKLRPADWEAAKKLALLLDTPEYESVIEPFIRTRPDDADVYATLGKLHERNHRYAASAADLEKASALDPNNARRHLSLAFAEYNVIAKDTTLDQAEKRKRIQHGLAEVDRGEALEPGLAAAMTWRSLLLREQAKLESDPEVKSKLLAEADAANALANDRFQRMVKPPLQKSGDNSLPEDAPRKSPADWQHVTSVGSTFEYRLPPDWKKQDFNSYRGATGDLLEQIYPPATISPEYCRSFRSFTSADVRPAEVENRVYDNGKVRGCFVVIDFLNTTSNKTTRHTSFRFATSRGIEDITIIEAMVAGYSAVSAKTIIDSVRTK